MLSVMDQQHDSRGSKVRKRARTAVACRRCKTRKQKCDGSTPTCSNCATSDSICDYDFSFSLSRSQEQYLRARRRVEELEHALGRLTQTNREPHIDHDLHSHHEPQTDSGRQATHEALVNSRPQQSHEQHTDYGAQERRESQTSHGRPSDVLSPMDSNLPPLNSPPQSAVSSASESSRAIQDLAIQAAGGFVGSPSDQMFGQVLHAVVTSQKPIQHNSQPGLLNQNLTPKSLESAVQPGSTDNITLAGIPDVVADRMFNKGYLQYIAVLWPVMQPSQLHRLHNNRTLLEDHFEIAALHLVYAAAGRFLETTGETGSFRSEQHYRAAMALVGEILTLSASAQTVQILLLLAIYGLRAPRGPGAWPMIGIAMRMCIELGLHRKRNIVPSRDTADDVQLRCIFWSCYCLDRQTSIILGRPFALADQDIDAGLPEGVDPESRESLTPFTHICRLRTIESRIQQTLYCVNKKLSPTFMAPEIDVNLRKLEAWKSTIPMDGNEVTSSLHNRDSYVSSLAWFDHPLHTVADTLQLIYYHQAVRFLLQPMLLTSTPADKYLLLAVQSCGGICTTYKRMHQSVSVGFSLMALHSVFFAGITILYCAWDSPTLILTNDARNMINDCSIVLYIITERWPGAKR